MDMKEAFKQAESNTALEGASPAGDPHYEDIKRRIIEGTLTEDQARKEILDFHAKRTPKS